MIVEKIIKLSFRVKFVPLFKSVSRNERHTSRYASLPEAGPIPNYLIKI